MALTKNKIILFFMVLFVVLIQENFIYMTDKNTTFILSISGLIIFIIKTKNIIHKHYTFKYLIIGLIIIELYGIIIAKIYYNQPFFDGLIGTHYIFMYGWYFAFVDTLKNKESCFYVKDLLISIGIFITLLLLIQGLLFNKIIFLHLNYSMRNGLRILGSYILGYVLILIYVDIVYKFTFKKFIFTLFITYYMIFFNQSRGTVLIYLICIIFIVLKRYSSEKSIFKVIILCFLTIIIFYLVKNRFIQNIVENILNEFNTSTGNVGVRLEGINYYWNLLLNHWFMGIGILGDKFNLKQVIYGTLPYGYYMEDIGTLAFIFKTGIIGIIWIILFYKKLIDLLIKNNKTYVGYLILFFVINNLVGITYVNSFDNKYGLIYFIIMLVVFETLSKDKMQNE